MKNIKPVLFPFFWFDEVSRFNWWKIHEILMLLKDISVKKFAINELKKLKLAYRIVNILPIILLVTTLLVLILLIGHLIYYAMKKKVVQVNYFFYIKPLTNKIFLSIEVYR